MKRHARCFALLDVMDDADAVGGGASSEDVRELKEGMDRYDFGASAAGKRLATAILKRMNAQVLLESGGPKGLSDEILYGDVEGKGGVSAVEFILPSKQPAKGSEWDASWSDDELREEWMNRIGNLALVSSSSSSGRRRAKGKNAAVVGEGSSWEAKKKRYKKESWPLTSRLHEIDEWNWEKVKEQQRDILSMMDQVWSLNTTGADE